MPWDPALYLKFHSERTQPSIDLVGRIELENPSDIIDLGCGPGNSTRILYNRWPNAIISGLDSSASMIEKAKDDFPGIDWILADAAHFKPGKKYDLIFSNAALQWIHGHDTLLPKLLGWLKPGGILAVQVPANSESKLHLAMIKVSKSEKWKGYTKNCESLIVYHKPDFYYKVLAPFAEKLNIWETSYFHILDSHIALIDWYKSTGMKTYLESLPDDLARNKFEAEVLEEIIAVFPLQPDSKVIYPFQRLFFVAEKKH